MITGLVRRIFGSGARSLTSIHVYGSRCYCVIREDHAHGLKFLGKHTGRKQIEKLLSATAIEIDFSRYVASGLIGECCPLKRIYVNQLPANTPTRDRWNAGLTQVDGVVSSFLFTVLDGHIGTACVHALAWAILDYVGASFLDNDKLELVLNHYRTHELGQPYHLARRLDLLSSEGRRRLGHAAGPPPTQLSQYIKRCLHDYVKDLVSRPSRNLDPAYCLTESLLRLDDDLCSIGKDIDLRAGFYESPPDGFPDDYEPTLSRDLIRVALSGAVGVTGRLYWRETESDPDQPIHLHVANVGDCGAVLLRLEDPLATDKNDMHLRAVCCTTPHQGAVNRSELERIQAEHPENPLSELFRDGGRLLGELLPSRAFGDVRYKWPAARLLEMSKALSELSSPQAPKLSPKADSSPLPHPYTSPPYLTAKPEVTHFEITRADRFLVLATDGFWEMLSIEEVRKIMEDELRERTSPATRLLWNCLATVPPPIAKAIANDGIGNSGTRAESRTAKHEQRESQQKSFGRAFKLLSLPPGLARYYRDDITVMVIELSPK
ncbi:unnamed protein product [Calicophoron daubneyi]|uniref:PPM-type phosphatase domain-containing protein n=1 Tax=Calicophoron daubneyi TaxID=300641 RepID=A0AAV2TLW6_CALDB